MLNQLIVDPLLSKSRFDRDTAPLVKDKENFLAIGIRLVRIDFPILIVGLQWKSQNKEILLHITADDYDYIPISGWWVDENDSPLKQGQNIPNGDGIQVNPYPNGEDRSWFCFHGWREYHNHTSHQDVSWNSIKHLNEYRILGIIHNLHSILNKSTIQSK